VSKILWKIYIAAVSLGGIYITYLSFDKLIGHISESADFSGELSYIIIMSIMCIICASVPVVISNNQSLDMSYVCIFSTLLIKGAYEAVVIAVVGLVFAISKQVQKSKDGSILQVRYRHIFNTPVRQSFFNIGNLAVSIFFPGLLYEKIYTAMGYSIGSMRMPGILWPMFVFLVLTLICNYLLLVALFVLGKMMKPIDAFAATFGELLPNLASIAPFGLLFAYILSIESGQYLVLLFIFPLLLARYSFNLYLDSKNQYYKMVKTLVVTLEAKDIYTKGHSQRVEAYAEEICMTMRMPMAQTEIVKIAALLHDIGKIGIGDTILGKPGRLTDDEFMVITTHPAIGVKILKEINVNPKMVQYVKYHHKWFNGCGYPDVDEGEEVPLESFILGVADAYDAMTSDRPYRKGFSPEKALQIIEESMGEQFHPEVAKAFLKIKRGQLERGEPVTELEKEPGEQELC